MIEGSQLGLLTVGTVERDTSKFPLTTPLSYRSHGETRWCHCKCGQSVIYPTSLLEKGNIKSCGCLKLQRAENRRKSLERSSMRKHLRDVIKELQVDLKKAQFFGRVGEAEALGSQLRDLFSKLASLS